MEQTRQTLEYQKLKGNLSQETADWKYIATKQQELLSSIHQKLFNYWMDSPLSKEEQTYSEDTLLEICKEIELIETFD